MTFPAIPFSTTLTAVINHMLARQAWAREQLMPYAERNVRVHCLGMTFMLRVQPNGYFAAADQAGTQPDVTLTLSSDLWPAFAREGKAAAMRHIKIEGDAEFAQALAQLAEHLRWEPEEDLAQLLGDARATRVMALARSAGNGIRSASRNLRDAIVDYLLDENPQLVRHARLDEFNAELANVRDSLARMEKRIEQLERAR